MNTMNKLENRIIYNAPSIEILTASMESGIAISGGNGEPGNLIYDPNDNTTL